MFFAYFCYVIIGYKMYPLVPMKEELDINDYKEILKGLCPICHLKCKNHDKICVSKKLMWNISKKEYKKRLKEGTLKDERV